MFVYPNYWFDLGFELVHYELQYMNFINSQNFMLMRMILLLLFITFVSTYIVNLGKNFALHLKVKKSAPKIRIHNFQKTILNNIYSTIS